MEDITVPEVWHNVLLRVSQAILLQRDIPSLLQALSDLTISVVAFDRVHLVLFDGQHERATLFSTHDTEHGHVASGCLLPLSCPTEIVRATKSAVTYSGAEFRKRFPEVASLPLYQWTNAYCQVPVATTQQVLGGLEFFRRDGVPFSNAQIALLMQIGSIVAIGVENLRAVDHVDNELTALRHERDHYRVLVDVTNAVISKLDVGDLVSEIAESIRHFFGIDYISLDIFDPATQKLRAHSVYFQHDAEPMRATANIPLSASLAGRVFQSKAMFLVGRVEMESLARTYDQIALLTSKGFQVSCTLPLISGSHVLGALNLAHGRADAFSQYNLNLLQEIAARISIAMDNAMAYEEISRLKDKLTSENLYLTEEISNWGSFGEIVGESSEMAAVLEQVGMVADSDCTVLILGETGTGKELIARAIHNLSARKARTMVKVNCAAIPSGLLESDLFGHERGAFTGASSQRVGRFELADHGTLFLDEIGDIPMELQPKLLRALQEREIERVGGSKSIPVDVRLIAATNRDLTQMVADREYRSDLYYRLNVFPIVIPPLRERPQDIPLLAKYFTQKIARRMNRNIESIPAETLEQLSRLPWPGNVRELENVIERAVILTRGPVLNLPLHELQYHLAPVAWKSHPAAPAMLSGGGAPIIARPVAPRSPELPVQSEAPAVERDRIIQVLKETNGIVAGPRGAAARLGLKRTTLLSRMQRLGISSKELGGGGADVEPGAGF